MSVVTSKDGTKIGYSKVGSGPALLLVDGALCYRDGNSPMPSLAELLKNNFTVYTYDRRGRGESDDTSPYNHDREIEDIDALINVAGGHVFLYGISSGASLAALAAGKLPTKIDKFAFYESPFIVDDSRPPIPSDFLPQLKQAIKEGKRSKAVKMFLKLVGVPRFILPFMSLMPGWSKGTTIAHTLVYDISLVAPNMRGKALNTKDYIPATMPVLAMAGGKSPVWMQNANKALGAAFVSSEFRIIPGQVHMLKVDAIAPILISFFKEKN